MADDYPEVDPVVQAILLTDPDQAFRIHIEVDDDWQLVSMWCALDDNPQTQE